MQKSVKLADIICRYFMPGLFLIGNLKFFKMVLSFVGLASYATILSSVIFALLDACLLFLFLHIVFTRKRFGNLLLLILINAVFVAPHFIRGEWYRIVQYALFMVPFTLAADIILIDEDGNGIDKFFRALSNISRIAVLFAGAYILALFFLPPGEYGILEIPEFSYGDIAYAILPCYFIETENFFDNQDGRWYIPGIRVLVYLAALIYTGARSAFLCIMVVTVIQIFRKFRVIRKMKLPRISAAVAAYAVVFIFSTLVVPGSSRLSVVKDDFVYELNGSALNGIGDGIDSIIDSIDNEENNAHGAAEAYNVATKKDGSVAEIFEYYIIKNDTTMEETVDILRADIKSGRGKYIKVSSDYKESALSYNYPIRNRICLWKTAFNEFLNSPVFGNGPLYYQIKYGFTFPHNIAFEALADFGIIGLLVLLGAAGTLFFTCVYRDRKDGEKSKMLAFIPMYVPMYLLFTSLYLNGILFFTFAYMILDIYNGNRGKKNKPAAADAAGKSPGEDAI